MNVVALIPAHNEAESIRDTIRSLQEQTTPPDRVIVVADNCTDDTEVLALDAGAEVFRTVDNIHRKAGGQNQALSYVLPTLWDDDLVLSMDADSVLEREFIENARRHHQRECLGAVSGNHLVRREWDGVIEYLQAMEFERDRRYIGRKKGRVGCMTGMATIFRVEALRAVLAKYGSVYDESNWTEDWKLTFTIKLCGFKCVRPQDCVVHTIPVPHWKLLFVQRQRWGRGFFQCLTQLKITRHTWKHWIGQAMWFAQLGIWAIWMMFFALSAPSGRIHFPLWAFGFMAILLLTRTAQVAKIGPKAMLLSLAVIPEMAYSWIIQAATIVGVAKHILRLDGQWGRVRVMKGGE